MDLKNAINASELARELGISHTTARNILLEVGAGVRLGNSLYYDRGEVREVIRRKNVPTLIFLGLPASPLGDADTSEHSES